MCVGVAYNIYLSNTQIKMLNICTWLVKKHSVSDDVKHDFNVFTCLNACLDSSGAIFGSLMQQRKSVRKKFYPVWAHLDNLFPLFFNYTRVWPETRPDLPYGVVVGMNFLPQNENRLLFSLATCPDMLNAEV